MWGQVLLNEHFLFCKYILIPVPDVAADIIVVIAAVCHKALIIFRWVMFENTFLALLRIKTVYYICSITNKTLEKHDTV